MEKTKERRPMMIKDNGIKNVKKTAWKIQRQKSPEQYRPKEKTPSGNRTSIKNPWGKKPR